jgi:hypothetical protein
MAILAAEAAGAAKESSPRKAGLRAFMRQKLAYSQGIVEGLSLEKFDLISKNALRMKNMTQSNLWFTIKQADYMEHTDKFQRNIDALFKAASDQDLNAATEAYGRVTKDCGLSPPSPAGAKKGCSQSVVPPLTGSSLASSGS